MSSMQHGRQRFSYVIHLLSKIIPAPALEDLTVVYGFEDRGSCLSSSANATSTDTKFV